MLYPALFWFGLAGSGGWFAASSVCRPLINHADRLYHQALVVGQKQTSHVWRCRNRSVAYQAMTLYRAFLVSRCQPKAMIFLRMGQLLQACTQQGEESCRWYGRYLQTCPQESSCLRSSFFRHGVYKKFLPFSIREAFEDRDGDGFKGCHRTVIRCSNKGRVEISTQAGLIHHQICDCDDSDPRVKPGGQEICDGKDNDCDGKIDEPEDMIAPFCPKQQGVCRGARKQCGGVHGWLPCDASVYRRHNKLYEEKETQCDGQDNDCDGVVDNQLSPPLCSQQRGVCRGAKQTCHGVQGWQDCLFSDLKRHNPAYETQEQQCDGLDNDCDGKIDNIKDIPSCTLRVGVCQGAKQTCLGKQGWQDCTPEQLRRYHAKYEPKETRCDGLDNDCDGRIDAHCIPVYPWVIAGSGAAILVFGVMTRVLAYQSPETVAPQNLSSRPDVSSIKGWLTAADTLVVLGSVAAVSGVGLGVGLIIRALQARHQPPLLRAHLRGERTQSGSLMNPHRKDSWSLLFTSER